MSSDCKDCKTSQGTIGSGNELQSVEVTEVSSFHSTAHVVYSWGIRAMCNSFTHNTFLYKVCNVVI